MSPGNDRATDVRAAVDLKLLGRNALIYMVGNAALRGAAFLLIPLYTHMLSQADFGMLFTLFFTMQIMLVLANLGIRESLARFVSEAAAKGRVGELLGSSLAATLGGAVAVSAAALLLFAPFLQRMLQSEHTLEYLGLCCAATAAQALCGQLVNFYRARNQALSFMIAGLSTAVLLLAANVVALWWLRLGVRGALMAQLVAYALALVGVAAFVLPRTGLGFSRTWCRRVVAFGAPLVMAEFCWTLMTAAPVYFLGHWVGLEAVAVYSLGFKLAQAVTIVLVLPFDLAYAPFVFANLERADIRRTMGRILTYFLLAFAAVAFASLVVSRELIPVIAPPGYSEAILVLLFLLPAIGFEGLHAFAKTQLLIAHRTYLAGVIAVLVGILSLGLNLVLVPRLGLLGAVGACDLATAAMAVLVLAAGMRCYPVRLDYRRIGVISAGFAALAGGFMLLRDASRPAFYGALVVPAMAAPAMLYLGRFFSEEERLAIGRALRRLAGMLRAVLSRALDRGTAGL